MIAWFSKEAASLSWLFYVDNTFLDTSKGLLRGEGGSNEGQ
jgi:hypothetical protein